MKVAVFHNFMDNIGGAEMVGLTLANELKADFYSTNIDEEKIRKMGFKDTKVISIGKIPVNAPFRQQAALMRFRALDLRNKYDFFIIGGDWAISGAIHNKPNLWYVHSPIREIWDLYQYTRQNTVPWYLRWGFDGWVGCNRYFNRKYIQHVDKLACNSLNTRNRIKKYLGREAAVIHPPIKTTQFFYRGNGDYWLSVNRLITHKRVDMQMEAFSRLPDERLIVIGSHEQSGHFQRYADHIRKKKPKNVEIISWVDRKQLLEFYADCKGFISTSLDEDFGMAVVEAMASGKPVIAPNEGGYKETMVDGVTGKLTNGTTIDELIAAIREVGKNPQKYQDACLAQARQFDTAVFIHRIKEQIGWRE